MRSPLRMKVSGCSMLKSLDFMRYAGLDVIEAPARIEPILSLSKDTPVTD